MKRLTLLRHAKSGWDDPVSRDFDRPLNGRGKKASETIGRWLKSQEISFDYIAASPAVRVVETIDHVAIGYGETMAPVWDKRAYLASASSLLDIIHEAPDDSDTMLLVGHNPGLEDLILLLVPDQTGDDARDAVEEKYPTASLAEIDFDVPHWADVKAGGGKLAYFKRPRDLDPALGPEAL
ncbi:MAG: histidine phosphatase family protein [Sphingomonadaceae bacterium]